MGERQEKAEKGDKKGRPPMREGEGESKKQKIN